MNNGNAKPNSSDEPKQQPNAVEEDEEKTVQTSKCKGATTIPIFLKSKFVLRIYLNCACCCVLKSWCSKPWESLCGIVCIKRLLVATTCFWYCVSVGVVVVASS